MQPSLAQSLENIDELGEPLDIGNVEEVALEIWSWYQEKHSHTRNNAKVRLCKHAIEERPHTPAVNVRGRRISKSTMAGLNAIAGRKDDLQVADVVEALPVGAET